MSQSYLWAQYDALLEHHGKEPSNQLHHESVTTEETLKEISAGNDLASVAGASRAFVFSTGGSARGVCLSPQVNCTCDHLAVEELFPNGALSIKLLEIPGFGIKLINDWRIIISSGKGRAPLNKFVQSCLGIKWEGNIVLAYYHLSAPNWPKMNNVPLALAPLVILLLKRFLEVYQTFDNEAEESEEGNAV